MATHLHFDLVGGLSGDMFISAMLDAYPDLASSLVAVIDSAGFPELVKLEHQAHDDGTLTGTRFTVTATMHAGHHHRHYRDIRETLEGSGLEPATRDAALEIFRLVAEVEAAIHGKAVEDVAFHEVGAWDSIADIVLAAHLIVASGAASYSVSPVPLGGGFVETAHGRLPVPAPATARLLEGFEMFDDGVKGERVTPTGAAILKYLAPGKSVPAGFQLGRTGYGFGTKTFPGISNVARVVVYETAQVPAASGQPWDEDRIVRLSFDVDDQTPESLAQAAEQLMSEGGVLDVTQQVYFGKKGRQGFTLVVLAREAAQDEVTRRCFEVTRTLGIRREPISRAVLRREEVVVYVGERAYRVKVALRPGGATAKVEMDDLLAAGLSLEEQQQVRQAAESLALEKIR